MSKSKNAKAFVEKFDRKQSYSVAAAVDLIKECAKVRKYDETVDIALNLGIDPKHADQQVRGRKKWKQIIFIDRCYVDIRRLRP